MNSHPPYTTLTDPLAADAAFPVPPNPEPPLPDYWQESARPLVSLAFIAPMLAAYELGMVVLGPSAVRNGAEVWLRQFLDWLGLGQYFLLPLLTCGLLLAWHHLLHACWSFRPSVLFGMTLESATLALGLLAFAQLQGAIYDHLGSELLNTPNSTATETDLAGMLGYFGAGLYEELLFRLTMLPLATMLLRGLGMRPRGALVLAVLAVSLCFSLAHYRWDLDLFGWQLHTSGYAFDWFSFSFRFAAGTVFSALFVCRGFGIAVGAHALYDVFAVLI